MNYIFINGSFLATLLVLAFIAFAHWRQLRDQATPWYIIYLFAVFAHYLRQHFLDSAMDYQGSYPPNPPLRWDSPFSLLALGCYVMFIDRVLDFLHHSPRLHVIFTWAAYCFFGSVVVHIFLQAIGRAEWANEFYQLIRVVSFPSMLSAIVYLRLKATKFYQRLILWGTVFLVIGFFSAIFTYVNPDWNELIPTVIRVFHTPWGDFYLYHMKVGVFLDILCFSWALTLIHKEKIAELEQKIGQEKQVKYILVKNDQPIIVDGFVQQVDAFLEENYSNEKLRIGDIASHLCLSISQTNRKIKEHTQQTTEQYLRKYRLQKGWEMLGNIDKNVTDIAFAVGFNDSAHFASAFKKEFGCSPSEMRKRLMAGLTM
jgi:AraC-like DNA-binding protein